MESPSWDFSDAFRRRSQSLYYASNSLALQQGCFVSALRTLILAATRHNFLARSRHELRSALSVQHSTFPSHIRTRVLVARVKASCVITLTKVQLMPTSLCEHGLPSFRRINSDHPGSALNLALYVWKRQACIPNPPRVNCPADARVRAKAGKTTIARSRSGATGSRSKAGGKDYVELILILTDRTSSKVSLKLLHGLMACGFSLPSLLRRLTHRGPMAFPQAFAWAKL